MTTYQVAFAVPLVNKVAGVPPTGITVGVFGPFGWITVIVDHQIGQGIDVDIIGGQSRRRAKGSLHGKDEFLELVGLREAHSRLAADGEGTWTCDDIDGHDGLL